MKTIKDKSSQKQHFIKNITLIDIVLLLIFPLILFILMFLPSKIHTILTLNIHDPSWWQFLTNAFMHKDWNHLKGNLMGYLFFIIPTFLIILRNNNKKQFYKVLFWTILTTPIITSLVTIWIYPQVVPTVLSSQGASGIIAGLLGTMFMFFLSDMYIKSKNKLKIKNFLSLGILLSVFIVAVINYIYYTRSWSVILIIAIIIAIIIWLIYALKKQIKNIIKNLIAEYRVSKFNYYLTMFLPLLFIFVPFQLFPSQLKTGGAVVDIFVHYVGLLYGILISYYILKWK
jgi:membrane associated rhomboid family serine protease